MEQHLKILLLEDSPTDAEIIQRLLVKEMGNCVFHLTMDKAGFLMALDEFCPDVILSDNSLPRFNATEALKIARELCPHVPFILITGTVSEEYAANIIKQGADDYILKDRMTRLPTAIDTALRQRKTEKEKLEAAEKLRDSEENYRTILERVSDAFVAIDKDWCYTYVNKRAGEIMKREPNTLIGKYIWTEFSEDIGQSFKEAYQKAMESQQYIHLEAYYAPFDAWLENDIYPSPNGLSVFFRDITRRKKEEQQKEFDRNNLSALINNTDDLMWSVDRDLKLITFNNSFSKVTQLMAGNQIAKGDDILSAQFPIDQLNRYKLFYERALSGEAFTVVDCYDLPIEFWSEISFYPIRKGIEVIGTACFSRNITERRKAEAELKKMEAALFDQQRIEQLRITAMTLEAQEKERNAIGIELHDNVNQILAGTKLILSAVKADSEEAQQLIGDCMYNLQDAINENRKIAHELVAPNFREKLLTDQLLGLAENMLMRAGMQAHVNDSTFNETLLNDAQKLAVYRIAQEQCTNITKYANANQVNITISTIDNVCSMTIKDDGVGMEAGKKIKGIGISNIKSRLSIFNGTTHIDTAPGKGFLLEITIPLNQ